MSLPVETKNDIPNAPYYVLANDTYFKGLQWNDTRINTIILPCDSEDQALIVAQNAADRREQKYIRIVCTKPKLLLKTHRYHALTVSIASAWYRPNSFRDKMKGLK